MIKLEELKCVSLFLTAHNQLDLYERNNESEEKFLLTTYYCIGSRCTLIDDVFNNGRTCLKDNLSSGFIPSITRK